MQIVSSLAMILALLWLTVSLPYVYAARKQAQKTQTSSEKKDNSNPLANANEEKPPSNISINEEYLHGQQHTQTAGQQLPKKLFLLYNESTYNAFHGELLTPPPNLHS